MKRETGYRTEPFAVRVAVAWLCAVFVLALAGCGGGAPPAPATGEPRPVAGNVTGQDEVVEIEATEPAAPETVQDDSAVVAHINGKPVTRKDLDDEMQRVLQRTYGGRVPPESVWQEQRDEIEDQAMKQLVLKEQFLSYANAHDIVVEASVVEERMGQIASRFPSQEELSAALAQAGMTLEQLREDIGRSYLYDQAVGHYRERMPEPADAELQTYYAEHEDQYSTPEQVTASHILLSVTEGADEAIKTAKRAEIDAVRERLLAGADFAELAREHSDCPSSGRGGDLGSFTRGRMVPEFDQAAFALEPGAISDVVQTQFGYHIIRVATHEVEGLKPLADVRERVVNDVRQENLNEWFDELVKDATVEKP